MSPQGPHSTRTTASTTTQRGDRYGAAAKKSSGDLTGKAMALVLVAILIAALFYAYQYFTTKQEVNASISYVSHEVVDDSTLRVWSDVTRNDPNATAYCIVQAYDYSKAEVGRREFALPANGEANMRVAVDIPTNARAVAGGVYGCSSEVPAYLDAENPRYANS
ncbi:DUF4307 domain-containing protein [Corynebacterium endometrii]|nr:DUF4307 domain-containing protein [Corynebacterium endometrii]